MDAKNEQCPEEGEQGESCEQFTSQIRCPYSAGFGQYTKALL
jgi:hypothetical protein